MLAFPARMEIIEVLDENKVINNVEYRVAKVRVADIETYAYLKNFYSLSEVKYITSDVVYLTNLMPDSVKEEGLCFRVGYYTSLPAEEYEPMEFIDVNVNGRIFKGKQFHMKKVGRRGNDFCSCNLGIKNEENKVFYCLIVGFNEAAIKLNNIERGTHVDINARLLKRAKFNNYELNITTIEPVRSKRNDEEI